MRATPSPNVTDLDDTYIENDELQKPSKSINAGTRRLS